MPERVPNNQAYVNSNREPVSVGQQPTKARFTIEIQMDRYETGSGFFAKQKAYTNKVHKGEATHNLITFPLIGSAASAEILCKSLDIVEDFIPDSPYVLCRYIFWLRAKVDCKKPDGSSTSVHDFRTRIPDAGFTAFISNDKPYGEIVYADGAHAGEKPPLPVLLNGRGKPKDYTHFKVLDISGEERPFSIAAEPETAPTEYLEDDNGVVLLYDDSDGEADMFGLNLAANL